MNLIKFLITFIIIISIKADIDQNGKIIANSPIKASDMTTRFGQITSALTNRNLPLPNQNISSYNIGDTVSSIQLISDFNKLPSFLELSAPVFSSTIFSTELNSAFDAAITKINEGTISFEGQYTAPQGSCNPCDGSCSVVSTLNVNSCEQLFNNIPTEFSNDSNCPSTLQQTISSPVGTNDKTTSLPAGTLSETYSCNEGETFATGTLTNVTCDGGFVENNLSCVPSDPFANMHIAGSQYNNPAGDTSSGDTNQEYPITDLISTAEKSSFDFANNGQFFVPVVDPREHVLSLEGFPVNSGTLNANLAIRKITGIGFVQGFNGLCQLFGKDSDGNVTRNILHKSSDIPDHYTETECKQYASEIYNTDISNIDEYMVDVGGVFNSTSYTIYYVNGQNIIGISEYVLKGLIQADPPPVSFYDVIYGLEDNAYNGGDYILLKYKDNLFPTGRSEPPNQGLRVSEDEISFVTGDFLDRSLLYTNVPYSAIDPSYSDLFGNAFTGCFLNHDSWPFSTGQMYTYRIEKMVNGDINSRTGDIGDIECNQLKRVLNKMINSKSSVVNILGGDVEANKAKLINSPPFTYE